MYVDYFTHKSDKIQFNCAAATDVTLPTFELCAPPI